MILIVLLVHLCSSMLGSKNRNMQSHAIFSVVFFSFFFYNGNWTGHVIPQGASAPLTELWKKVFAGVLWCLPSLVLCFAEDYNVFACHSVLSIFLFLLIFKVLLEDNNVWLLFAITLLVWGLSQVHWPQDIFFKSMHANFIQHRGYSWVRLLSMSLLNWFFLSWVSKQYCFWYRLYFGRLLTAPERNRNVRFSYLEVGAL